MLFLGAKSFAQTNGITYQAVILNPTAAQLPGVNNSNTPMVGKNICLQFQFIDEFSKVEYQETIQVKTDAFGMVNLIIGSGQQTGGYAASFKAIYWSTVAKKLAVGVNVKGSCNTFVEISNQDFSFVPFAYSANNAENVTGVVPIENGGTNATTVIQAKTNLQLQNVNNTSDANKPISAASQNALNLKVDKVTGKVLSTNDYTTPEKTKLAAIIGTNTGDQVLPTLTSLAGVAGNMAITGATKTKVTYDAKGLVTAGADATTADIAPSSNKNYVTDAQAIVIAATLGTNTGDETATTIKTKLGVTTLAGSNTGDQDLTGKVDKVTGKGLSTNDYSTAEKTKLSAITGTNTGDQTTITGNAGTATKLATAIKINGVAFDGSTDITISSAAAGVASAETLTGTTLKSTVTASGLTSVGTLTNLTVTNPIAGSVTGTADNVTGVIAVANGGSGASSLTGYIKGNGTSAFTTLSKIPVTDITAAVQKVNGITPDGNGNVTLAFGNVTTGMLASRPLLAGTNGDIYVISGDATVAENGRTYISDGTAWNEVISNQAATDTRYVKLSGSTMVGNVTFPSGTKATMVDAPTVSTDLVNKTYVDAQATADASGSSKGKIKLAGDLSGTADLPSIANNAILTSKILDGNVTDAKIASLSASKLTGSVAPANGGTGLTAVGTNGQVLTSDGTSLSWASPGASGTTSLNGSTASTQTFAAPGTAGLAPTWSTASGAHTLNIPLASAPSVTAGLLSKADYDNFSAAYTNRITSVTTTGASGAATLVSNVLNIPSPSLDELAGTKAMNTVYAGPISGANTSPTFRALVAADIPILNQNTSGNAATATLATIATNVSGTVAVANGGTGAITLTGLVKGNGTGTMTAAVAGTDYLAPDGSAVNLTNFPVLNQNTLGNAATSTLATTATTAGNVSGTVAVANGGTGAITLTGLVKGNGTGTMTAAVAGTDYLAPDGSAVNLTNFPVLNQNTLGNAATSTLATTATTAGNVSGTVAVANGGTGAITLTGLVKGNGTGTMTAAVAGTDYLAPTGSAALLTSWPTLNQNTSGNAATATLATLATTATTSTHIAGGLGGAIPYQTAANTTAMLANGSSGQVLTSQGTTLAPVWATASSGGVPYTGATGAVNLGAFDLKVNNLTVGNGSGGIASNTAIGSAALYSNTSGHQNTANGNDALNANTTGIANTAIGSAALYSNTAGSGNTANGAKALDFNTVGTYNTAIGYGADVASENLTNATAIGNDAIVGASNTIQLGNTNVTAVKTSGAIIGGNTATSTISGFAANMNAQTGTTYTLLASDNGKIITLTNAVAITLTIPTLFAGFNCMIVQLGAGAVTLTVSGTTISNRSTFTKTAGTNAIATLIALTSTTFISAGDMQ